MLLLSVIAAKAVVLETLWLLGRLASPAEGGLPLGLCWLAGRPTELPKRVVVLLLRLRLLLLLLLHSTIEELRLEAAGCWLAHRLLLLVHPVHHRHGSCVLVGLLLLGHLVLGRFHLLSLAVPIGHGFESSILGRRRHMVLLTHHLQDVVELLKLVLIVRHRCRPRALEVRESVVLGGGGCLWRCGDEISK